jgi:hypothetical protein
MRYSRFSSKLLLAAVVSGAVVLAIPVVVSATPSTPLQSAHLVRVESIQKAEYHWHHPYSHRRYSHYRKGYRHYG